MLLDPAWRDITDPIERVFALLARYREALIGTDCFYGCPIGNLALEIHEPDPAVRGLIAANFDAWVARWRIAISRQARDCRANWIATRSRFSRSPRWKAA
jgi:hypothetical protein